MEIVLGRIGHYYDAGNDSCATAIVVDTHGPDGGAPTSVNVRAWHHSGEAFTRTSVPVDSSPSAEAQANSFHLTRDCHRAR